ncbi:hypothetical protein FOXG_20110 [Fusarium oxysporum f. sp. lycopersici 4287]|uniref:Uncharacterized protein n=2 Tax=Fusarium oxysporum TaxID=5507 RepID=A0A0J9VBY5_FUSO4|nr:hypothetical protein FOXG_20110 [Fusarium oxysporum f. sp. lycopersici 4287]EXK29390.1 hypothetical protein FOMG_14542 [Fusarium oxysporum f. sp. melonis 26406]KNB08964.1 hypothetical protein FOXG_20110 [Fusarium oxysporum f. sp. lycopersici 4287]
MSELSVQTGYDRAVKSERSVSENEETTKHIIKQQE